MRLKILFIFPFLFAFIIISVGTTINNSQPIPVNAANKNLIVIDAGHGGVDPGAVQGNVYEKDIALEVAKKVKKGLEKKGIKIVLTNESDNGASEVAKEKNRQLASLAKRVSLANNYQANALVSIHINSSHEASYFGPQTYYRKGAVKGQLLAEKIQRELTHIRMTKRKAIEGDYYILNNSSVPAVIVELGFMSNYQELELLAKESYRQLMADAIVTAIIEYLNE